MQVKVNVIRVISTSLDLIEEGFFLTRMGS